MKRHHASADAGLTAGLPQPRAGEHDVLDVENEEGGVVRSSTLPRPRRPVEHRSSVLPHDVEQRLAELAGVEPPLHVDAPDHELESLVVEEQLDEPEFARQVLRVAQVVTVGGFVLIVLAAMLAARFGDDALRVHAFPFAAWGLGATACALTLATLSGEAYSTVLRPARRRALGVVLMAALLAAMTGVVANAGGIAGPAWVLFLPIVLVAGAVTGPALGLLIGAGAAMGVYVAAALTDTLTAAGLGRLVVLLPAFPTVGWSAGALAGLAREAARDAHWRRQALLHDVRSFSTVLDRVADGDLSVVPAPGPDADPATTSLAVVFADTLLSLRRLVRQMDAVAGSLVSRSVELAGAAEQESTAITAQVSAVAETTSTVEQLAATANGIAETAVRVSQYAGSTRRDVDAGVAAVDHANEAMQRIAERVSDLDARSTRLGERVTAIDEMTRSIDELARRTTILSVNASIEAARAGDHGHGFGTVAHEVAQLAERARTATRRIDDVVAELRAEIVATAAASRDGQVAVEEGVELQQVVVAELRRIATMVDRTTAASREITEATRQQRYASVGVVEAMECVTASGAAYRAGGARHAAAAARLRDLAEGLRTALGRFRAE